MLRIGLLLLILFQLETAFGQVLSVRESASEKPMEYVTIASQKSKMMVQTNDKGEADISSFKGQEKINSMLFGYIPITRIYPQL